DELRIGVDRAGIELALGRRHGAELQQGERAAADAVVLQDRLLALVERGYAPVGLDLHAERLLRDQAIEGAVVERRAPEIGRELLRIAGEQVGTGRPER